MENFDSLLILDRPAKSVEQEEVAEKIQKNSLCDNKKEISQEWFDTLFNAALYGSPLY